MANTAFTQSALASDSTFATRVRANLVAQALVVLTESPFTISAITAAASPVLTTSAHGLATGTIVGITVSNSNSTPSIDGAQVATVVDATHLKLSNVTTTGTGSAGTFTITARAVFARQVLNDSNRETARVCPIITTRAAINAFTTSYDFTAGHVVTAAADGDLFLQLAADWNILSGV